MEQRIKQLVAHAQKVLIIQADNPDADSLASALALEQIFGELGKNTYLYCGVDMPGYLKYLEGWSRVSSELPGSFDLSFIVDASTMTLLQKLQESGKQSLVASKPCIVLDHHAEVDKLITFATINHTDTEVSSTGELVFHLAAKLKWPLDKTSAELIMTSILGDTQGLTNDLTKAETYRVMAKLVEHGANRPKLEEQRREISKMPQSIFSYKARLIERSEFYADNRLAIVDIPQEEIAKYSPLYNPNALIQFEHLQVEQVVVSVSIKHYSDGRITASIRCNTAAPIAAKIAEHFGGGGHAHAAGFKIENGKTLKDVKSECIRLTTELLLSNTEKL